MRLRDVSDLVRAAAVNWFFDYAQSMGAALAFYTIFSLAPLLLIVISLAGLVFGEEAAYGEIFKKLHDVFGASGALTIQGLVESAAKPADSVPAAVGGIAVLFIAATSVFAELQDALDRIWRAPARPGDGGWWRLVRGRLLSFGMIVMIGLLLMVSLAFSAGLGALHRLWDPLFSGWASVRNSIELALGIALSTAVFAMIYKTMPRVRIDWKDVGVGAAVTSLLFVAGESLIGTFIGRTGLSSGFGAMTSFVAILLWIYYCAQIFLFGAEFTWVYAHKFGSRRGESIPMPLTRAAPPAQAPPGTGVSSTGRE
jgi:membrane protein